MKRLEPDPLVVSISRSVEYERHLADGGWGEEQFVQDEAWEIVCDALDGVDDFFDDRLASDLAEDVVCSITGWSELIEGDACSVSVDFELALRAVALESAPTAYSSTGGSSSSGGGGGGGGGGTGSAGGAPGAKQFPNRKPLSMPPMMHMIQQSTTSITAIRMKMTRITVNAIAMRMAMSQQPQTLQQRQYQMHGFVAPHHRVNVGTKTVHTWAIDVASLATIS